MFLTLKSIKADRHQKAFFKRIGLDYLQKKLATHFPKTVQAGPFKGMQILDCACGSVWLPKLFGSYESELHPIFESLSEYAPDLIIDIGCAEGYYAAGLGKKFPETKVFAADTNPFARRNAKRSARLNNLQNITITGFITSRKLNRLLARSHKPFVLMDIEGGETALLDLQKIPGLRKAFILVENHKHITGIDESSIVEQFAPTHVGSLIDQTKRILSSWIDQDTLARLSEQDERMVVNEFRPSSQKWIVLRPRLPA